MDLTKSAQDATGLSTEEIERWWVQMPVSPFRLILEYELEKRRQSERLSLEGDLTYEKYLEQKGIVKGIAIAVGILNRRNKQNK